MLAGYTYMIPVNIQHQCSNASLALTLTLTLAFNVSALAHANLPNSGP